MQVRTALCAVGLCFAACIGTAAASPTVTPNTWTAPASAAKLKPVWKRVFFGGLTRKAKKASRNLAKK